MARARNIKPALFENELLGEADPLITLLFIGLWSLSDSEGKLEYRPKRIKVQIFPYRDIPDLSRFIRYLHDHDFLKLYEVDGKQFIEILNFVKHQNPHKNEKPKGYPDRPVGEGFPIVSGKKPSEPELSPSESGSVSLSPDPLLLNPDSGNLNDDVSENGATPEQPSSSFEKPWLKFEKRLTSIGHDPIRLANHRKQFKLWHDDGVTLRELDSAIEASQKSLGNKGDSEPPPVKYIATVIASNRKQSEPVSAGAKEINTHTGLAKKDFSRDKASGKFKNVVGGSQ